MDTEARQRHPTARPAPVRSPILRDPTRPGLLRPEPPADTRGQARGHRPSFEPDRRRLVRRALRDHVSTDFRPDVEGLRAIAVGAVLLYHANLLGITGGYVGVDVFFVLSGFLITRLLVRELASTGTLSLSEFWARRMRRLLPASGLMIGATVLVGLAVLSPLALRSLAADTVASGTYTANFHFAHSMGDYFGAQLSDTVPSPLLHMWSLAVEEQFYVIWPLLLLLLTRRPRQLHRLIVTVVGGLFAVGLGVSVWTTTHSPTNAYYLLPSRMNELLAGAAVALGAVWISRLPASWRAAGGWAGLAAIGVALYAFDGTTAFPGIAALLPVLGTAAVVISGGQGAAPWSPGQLMLGHPAMQWIGARSYALYLWHWPVLVLAAARWGDLGVVARIVALAVSVGLAAVSFRFVEDPARHARWLTDHRERSLALGSVFCLALTGIGWQVARANSGTLAGGGAAAAPQLTDAGPLTNGTTGPAETSPVAAAPAEGSVASAPHAASTNPLASVTAAEILTPTAPTGQLARLTASLQRVLNTSLSPAPVPSNLSPSLRTARNKSKVYADGCVLEPEQFVPRACRYGLKSSDKVIVLTGDSHAAAWVEGADLIARSKGYALVVLLKRGCPYANVKMPTPVLRSSCPAFHDKVAAWVAKNKPALVIATSSYEMPKNGPTVYDLPADQWAAGVEESVAQLSSVTPNLVIVGDNPRSDTDVPDCLSRHLRNAAACAIPRDKALRLDRRSAEIASARAHHAVFVDTINWFCAPASCPAVVGNILMFRDASHMSTSASTFLRPLLEAALAPALAR